MRRSLILLFALFFSYSCSKSDHAGAPESLSGSNASSSESSVVTVDKAEKSEINELNMALNSSEQYRLSEEEISTLFQEGAITEEERSELLSLIQ